MSGLSFGNSLNQLAISKGKAFTEQVDNITEQSPIVRAMPFNKSSDQLWDVSSELKMVSSVQRVDLNSPLPSFHIADAMRQTQLSIFGATSFVPEDTAILEGGPDKYFSKNRKSMERQTGMDMEQSYIYSAFLPYALSKNKEGYETVQNAGGNANTNYSLIVARFDETNLSGLYSPLAFNRATFLDIKAINGGQLYQNPDKDHQFYNVLGYGMRMLTYVGVRMLSHRNISAIVNIDVDATTPLTKKMVQRALLSARAGEAGKTMIMCHPKVKLVLEDIGKIQSISTEYKDKNANFTLESWDGVPIVTSYNFMEGTETNISV